MISMKRVRSQSFPPSLLVGLIVLGVAASQSRAETDLVSYVNPLIGTDSHPGFSRGNTYPAICLPFGMTTWTPQTGDHTGWIYTYDATAIYGIKATHQPSPWMGDYGDFAVMPFVGQLRPHHDGRKSRFSHSNEVAEPNYYRVQLDDQRTTVELTPTTRCSAWRITFPDDGQTTYLLFDVFDKGEIAYDPERGLVQGVARHNSGGIAGPFGCRFIARINLPIVAWGTFSERGELLPRENTGKGLYLQLDTSASRVAELQIGTSFISYQQSEQNLQREIGDRSFDVVRSEGRKAWNDALAVIEISGASESQRTTFYSCLYRASSFPAFFTKSIPATRRSTTVPTTARRTPARCTPTTASGIRFARSIRCSR